MRKSHLISLMIIILFITGTYVYSVEKEKSYQFDLYHSTYIFLDGYIKNLEDLDDSSIQHYSTTIEIMLSKLDNNFSSEFFKFAQTFKNGDSIINLSSDAKRDVGKLYVNLQIIFDGKNKRIIMPDNMNEAITEMKEIINVE